MPLLVFTPKDVIILVVYVPLCQNWVVWRSGYTYTAFNNCYLLLQISPFSLKHTTMCKLCSCISKFLVKSLTCSEFRPYVYFVINNQNSSHLLVACMTCSYTNWRFRSPISHNYVAFLSAVDSLLCPDRCLPLIFLETTI